MTVAGRLGQLLTRLGERLARPGRIEGIWIDVGAHQGEQTLRQAILNPALKVYALEPNLAAASRLIDRVSNYFVIPMAIAETDGAADFRLNRFDAASSLLPFNDLALKTWIGGEVLAVESVTTVPTIRLDTFMKLMGIAKVDLLKIDAQGMDLAVVRSCGSRLSDVTKIVLEVDLTPNRLYLGAASKKETVAYLREAGFSLVGAEKQTHGQEENLTFARIE
jgi:FkbM family methyltransferase